MPSFACKLPLSVLLNCLVVVIVLLQTSSAVVRPGHFGYVNNRKALPGPPKNGTNDEIARPAPHSRSEQQQQQQQQHPYVTAQHCCKIGEYMSRRSSTCRLDQSIRTNSLLKGKRLPRQPLFVDKSLQLQVVECHQHQHLLQKCCLNRRMYVRAIEFCQDESFWLARLKCKWEAEEKYGYRD